MPRRKVRPLGRDLPSLVAAAAAPAPTATDQATLDAQAILAKTGNPPAGPVGQQLQTSRIAHRQYQRFATTWVPGRIPAAQPNPVADPTQAQQQLTLAAQTRAFAQTSDPTHTDPAWALEQGTTFQNGPLLSWYRAQLGA